MPFCKNCQDTHPRPVGKQCKATTSNEKDSAIVMLRGMRDMMGSLTKEVSTLRTELDIVKQGSTRQSTQQPGTSQSDTADGAQTAPTPETRQGPPAETHTPGADRETQVAVRRRLREAGMEEDEDQENTGLSKSRTKKSGLVRTATELVQHEHSWPHHFVFRNKGGERVAATYSQLTMPEFGYGFCMAMTRERDEEVRQLMLKYLTSLFKDAANAPWSMVKDCHAAIMHDMETGQLTWEDEDELRAMRLELIAKNAQPHEQGRVDTQPRDKGRPCGYCLKKTGREFGHPEDKCNRKERAETPAKNDC